MQRAIAASLEPHRNNPLRAAFGLWADLREDGLTYQTRMREEWFERERPAHSRTSERVSSTSISKQPHFSQRCIC